MSIDPKLAVIYVGGLGDEVNETMLQDAFKTFGEIKEIFIPYDKSLSAKNRGYGFIEYFEMEDAKSAIDNMHLNQIYGYTIRCNMAKYSIPNLRDISAKKHLEQELGS